MFSVGSIGAIGRGSARSLDALWRLAGFTPSFDFPFARNRSLVDAVTGQSLIAYTQAFSGTYVNSDRVITTAASNEPRFDHDPTTGESLGLLVEELSANGIRNNTMVGAAVGIPGTLPTNWTAVVAGGISREIVDISQISGINCLDLRIFGTSTNANLALNLGFEPVSGVASASGQAWAESAYLALVGGSLSGIANTRLYLSSTNGTSELAYFNLGNISLTSALTRFSGTASPSTAGMTAVRPLLWMAQSAIGSTIDLTLRIGLPQLEQGAVATSVIPTATAATTRSASLADLISSAIANNIRSFYCEFRSPAIGTRGVVSLNNNTANNRAAVITSGTDPRLVVHSGGVEQANVNGGTVTAGARTRVAVRIDNNDFAISINGAAVVTDTSGVLPTVDRIMIGRTQAGEFLNDRIAHFAGWNQLLSDATLRSLSSQ